MTRIMYGRLGIDWQDDGDDIVVPAGSGTRRHARTSTVQCPEIDDMPWPGFPPDLISIALVVATQCQAARC